MLCSELLALETGFHSYSYNIQLFKTQCFFHPANHSIRWLVTRGVRWLQDIAKTGRLFLSTDWAASHLLLKEPDINVWRVTAIRHDVDGARVAPMHMAGKCRVGSMDASWPSIWYGLFNGCQHQSISLRFACCSCLFWGICSRLSNFCLSHSWHGSLLSSWIAKGAAASSSFWGQCASVRLPAWEASCPREVEVFVFLIFPVENARCSMAGAIFEKAWNSGNSGIFRWYLNVSYILWYPCQINDLMTSFVALCGQMWARLITVQ